MSLWFIVIPTIDYTFSWFNTRTAKGVIVTPLNFKNHLSLLKFMTFPKMRLFVI